MRTWTEITINFIRYGKKQRRDIALVSTALIRFLVSVCQLTDLTMTDINFDINIL